MEVGPYAVVVTEVPGASVNSHEWRDIELARQSYRKIWGGSDSEVWALPIDPMDGRDCDADVYDARHYLAWIRDRGLGTVKLVTARIVVVRPHVLMEWAADPTCLLPPELRFWQVRAGDGWMPLWQRLAWFARRFAADDLDAWFRVACFGKLAAFPAGERERSPRQRERTAVAAAAIQVLATMDESALLYAMTVRPELVSRVLTVAGVGLAFTRTEETLGLPQGSVTIDNRLARWHKLGRPGYWIHSGDAADALAALLGQGRVTVADLGPAMARLIEGESAIGGAGRELEELVAVGARPDHRRIAALLTRPRLCKYLIPLLRGDEPLAHLSCAELQGRLLFETRDAPYSCTVLPERWAESARAVLEAANGRYPMPPEEVMDR
jgi:hypothetical protein